MTSIKAIRRTTLWPSNVGRQNKTKQLQNNNSAADLYNIALLPLSCCFISLLDLVFQIANHLAFAVGLYKILYNSGAVRGRNVYIHKAVFIFAESLCTSTMQAFAVKEHTVGNPMEMQNSSY